MELNDLIEGYREREEREMYRFAWHAANVMNVHLSKRHRVTPEKLLKKGRPVMTQEAKLVEFEKLMKALKGSR